MSLEAAPALLVVAPLVAIVTVPASARPGDCQLEPSGPLARLKSSRTGVDGADGGGGTARGVAEDSLDCAPSPTPLRAATR